MTTLTLRIQWGHAAQFITIDPAKELAAGARVVTSELWQGGEHAERVATCLSCSAGYSRYELQLEFALAANPALATRDVRWGRCRIAMEPKKRIATAEWFDRQPHSGFDGAGKCRILDTDSLSYLGDLGPEAVRRILRPAQARLRCDLLAVDRRCAISGEETEAILDVALVAEAKDKGEARIENCLLLRTDLRRLFEARLLCITPSGHVTLAKQVSAPYQRDFDGRQLNPVVFHRISSALKARAGTAGA